MVFYQNIALKDLYKEILVTIVHKVNQTYLNQYNRLRARLESCQDVVRLIQFVINDDNQFH